MTIRTALDTAIIIAGNQAALAKVTGYSQQSISYWRITEHIPPVAAVKIHTFTNGRVLASALCPDVFDIELPTDQIREAS